MNFIGSLTRLICVCIVTVFISRGNVSAQCTFPTAYVGSVFFYQYTPVSSGPTNTDSWTYSSYTSTKVALLNVKGGNGSLLAPPAPPRTCYSSYVSGNSLYITFGRTTAPIAQYCAKMSLNKQQTALVYSEVQTTTLNASDASQCAGPNIFNQTCLTFQTSPCTSMWKPTSAVSVGPPSFIPVTCPFQGSYQMSVTYDSTECMNDSTSTVGVSGSSMTISACVSQAKGNLYKNRPILSETLTCLGDQTGDALTAADLAAGASVLLLMSADSITIFCAKFNVNASTGAVLMSIDVQTVANAACHNFNYDSYVVGDFIFLNLTPPPPPANSTGVNMPSGSATTTATMADILLALLMMVILLNC